MTSQLYNLTRNAETLVGMVLSTKEDMQYIQNFCEQTDYACYVNIDWDGNWTMNITAPDGVSQNGYIGDWIILRNNTDLSLYTPARGTALFTVGAPA